MRLSENIKRIRKVMGLISEQETYTFTDKSEYEKALKIYNQAKKLSDESIRKFNAFKNSKFILYIGGEVYKDNWVARLHQQYDKLIKDKKLLDDRYLISQSEKPDAIIKPVRNWCTAWLTKRPTDGSSSIPEKDTEFIPLTASAKYPQHPSSRQYHYYDHEKYSWWGHICGTIYEPTMPEPILQTKHQIQPNFQSPPIKISSTPSGVLPIMQKPFEPNTPEKTKFMISWTPDGKCQLMKYYDTFEDMQKEVRDFDLPFLGSRTEGKPPNYAEYKTEKIQGKNFPEGPWFNSCTQKWDENLNENKDKMKQFLNDKFGSYVIYESMKVDDFGRLHDDDSKIVYPYSKIAKFVTWFDKEFGDYAAKQGWFIVSSDSDVPKIRYQPEDGNKFNLFFQVQRIDDPMDGEALFGRLKNDQEAYELAKKIGLVLDENGVVIGWENEIFI